MVLAQYMKARGAARNQSGPASNNNPGHVANAQQRDKRLHTQHTPPGRSQNTNSRALRNPGNGLTDMLNAGRPDTTPPSLTNT